MQSFIDLVLFGFIALCLLAFFVALTLLWVRSKLQAYLHHTYAVTDDSGLELLESVNIGGVTHWFHVRGRRRNNPILLFLHGGPGWPHIGWYDDIQRPWEDYFTVVQWDQRQTGKSYAPLRKIGHTITYEHYIQDAEAMIDHLRQRFGQDKIVLMGTSFGSNLGMHLVKRRPECLHAYIGVGQVVNKMNSARVESELLLEEATRRGDQVLMDKLTALSPFPNPENPAKSFYDNAFFLMDHESRYGKAYPCPDGLAHLFSNTAIKKWMSPHYTLLDHWHRLFGDVPGADHPFAQEFIRYDLPTQLGSSFDVPIFFFTGVDDFHIPATLSDEWFQAIDAPYKEHVWFEHSAHVPFETEPGEFLRALVDRVRPLTQSQKSRETVEQDVAC